MKSIVALLGDYYHKPEWSREALEAVYREQLAAGSVSLILANTDTLPAELASKPDAFILFKENRLDPKNKESPNWLDDAKAEAIEEYVKQGGRLLVWHSGLCHYQSNELMRELIRGHFLQHPKQNSVRFDEGNAEYAAVLEAHDEHYFVDCETDRTHVFLYSRSPGGESVAGWEHSYGVGRVCALTPAHNRETMQMPVFLSLLRRTLDRLMNDDKPEEG